MVTTSIENQATLAPAVRGQLGALRRWIRLYVWVEGLSCSIAWLGVAFWISLVVDWFFEPPTAIRILMAAVATLGFVWIVVQMIGRRTFVHLSDGSMAMLLERRFAQLDDSLLTAVVLTERHTSADRCSVEMLARTCRQANQRITGIDLHAVFDPVPLQRSMIAAGLFVATVGLFAFQSPDALATWTRRNLMFDEALWPRRTRLEVEGFKNRIAKVARGADFDLVAKADMSKQLVPRAVEVRYRHEGGARGRATMNRMGAARPGIDPFQEYSYTFQGILAPIRFDVVGGDDRVSDLRIEVVESPVVVEMALHCEFPKYMDRPPRTFPVTGVMQVPRGTRVTIESTANKRLARVQIDCDLGSQLAPPRVLVPADLTAEGRCFLHTVESLNDDSTLVMTLSDTDGITGRDPVRLVLVAVADESPKLTARLDGIGPSITAQARLPAVGTVTDDYGIDRVWFECAIDQVSPITRPIVLPTRHPTECPLDALMEVTPLRLTPGQRLLVSVKAADRYELGQEGPNVGTSERWLLDIVSSEDLRVELEKRELVLRQRFERIIEEVTETRDLLLRLDFAKPNRDQTTEGDVPTAGPTGDAAATKGEPGGEPVREPGNEPGDALPAEPDNEVGEEPDEESQPDSPQRKSLMRTLRIQRAMQNGRKNAHETAGVADAFDDIRRQFINNQIDTEELKRRLKQGIADPLHHVADEMFPALEQRLLRLQEEVADEELGPSERDVAREQVEEILLRMQQVLDRMIELEDFNEALELLRAIIESQEELGERFKERRKQTLRESLED
ncbi:MAG: hypothetical protein JXB62_00320 [Pirellulales bacterium]|nr:hypothetical protein [Pirellulales bacterium]